MATLSDVQTFDALFDSSVKCQRGVSWKPSTKHFALNAVESCLKMEDQLREGTWKNRKPRPIKITYPKPRDGLAIPFRDRVYQRTLNDMVLYPTITNSFILDNAACQRGKGTDFARKRLKKMLWNFYTHHGLDGYVLQIDVKSYYPSMDHSIVEQEFAHYLTPDLVKEVMGILRDQYVGDIGLNPGSQMVQLAGIAVLNRLDHFIKERLHCRYYIRYMDDFWILGADRAELATALEHIKQELQKLRFSAHPTKTHIRPLSDGFEFLGFTYRVTPTGKVLMGVKTESVRHERRKLARLVALAKKGRATRAKCDDCFESWVSHACLGNSWELIQRMKKFYHKLWSKKDGN